MHGQNTFKFRNEFMLENGLIIFIIVLFTAAYRESDRGGTTPSETSPQVRKKKSKKHIFISLKNIYTSVRI